MKQIAPAWNEREVANRFLEWSAVTASVRSRMAWVSGSEKGPVPSLLPAGPQKFLFRSTLLLLYR